MVILQSRSALAQGYGDYMASLRFIRQTEALPDDGTRRDNALQNEMSTCGAVHDRACSQGGAGILRTDRGTLRAAQPLHQPAGGGPVLRRLERRRRGQPRERADAGHAALLASFPLSRRIPHPRHRLCRARRLRHGAAADRPDAGGLRHLPAGAWPHRRPRPSLGRGGILVRARRAGRALHALRLRRLGRDPVVEGRPSKARSRNSRSPTPTARISPIRSRCGARRWSG